MKGVASTQYERDLDGKLIPVRGAITNYDENSVFGLDYGRKTYISMSLDEATRRAQQLVRATDGEIQGPKVVLHPRRLKRWSDKGTIQIDDRFAGSLQ